VGPIYIFCFVFLCPNCLKSFEGVHEVAWAYLKGSEGNGRMEKVSTCFPSRFGKHGPSCHDFFSESLK
jgi:hypothetical protein